MAIELTDDGTLDTVVRCSECGKEYRGNYDDGTLYGTEREAVEAYDAWVAEFITEITDEHDCTAEDE